MRRARRTREIEKKHEHEAVLALIDRAGAAWDAEPEGTIDFAAEEAKNRPAPHYMQV